MVDNTNFSLYMLALIALRLAIPFGLTILVGWGLRKLDARWRDEALQTRHAKPGLLNTGGAACAAFNRCDENARHGCPAKINPDLPCWELFAVDGHLAVKCLDCQFRKALLNTQTVIGTAS